ncbi:MAG: ion transporter [Verrucomicrobiota bacterium]
MKDKGNAAYQLTLLALSIYVLVVLFLDAFVVSNPQIRSVFQYIDLAVCLVFLADFFVNLFSARNKLGYLKWGWIDLLSSIPLVDPLRWGRISRIVRILRFLRSIKSTKVLLNQLQKSRYQSVTFAVILITFVTYTVCSALILEFESRADGAIQSAKNALWLSFLNIMNAKVAITQAQTTGGMIITVLLNKTGLLLFAYFNAMIFAWLIGRRINQRDSGVLGGV